jgi:hypothetical protein
VPTRSSFLPRIARSGRTSISEFADDRTAADHRSAILRVYESLDSASEILVPANFASVRTLWLVRCLRRGCLLRHYVGQRSRPPPNAERPQLRSRRKKYLQQMQQGFFQSFVGMAEGTRGYRSRSDRRGMSGGKRSTYLYGSPRWFSDHGVTEVTQ